MSLESAKEIVLTIANELNDLLLLDANDMFHRLIEYEKELTSLNKEEFVQKNYVRGCISNAFVIVEEHNKKARIRGHSDAMVVRGLMGILAIVFSELSIKELVMEGEALVQDFINRVHIHLLLTPTRANAFGSIVQHITSNAHKLIA